MSLNLPEKTRGHGIFPSVAFFLAISMSFLLFSCMAGSASGFSWTGFSEEKLRFRQTANYPSGTEGVFTGARRNNRFILAKPLDSKEGFALRISIDCLVPGSVLQVMLSSRLDGTDSWSSGQFLLGVGVTNLILPFVADRKLNAIELLLQPENASTRAATEQILSIRGISTIPNLRGFQRTDSNEINISTGFKFENLSNSSVITITNPFKSFSTGFPEGVKNSPPEPYPNPTVTTGCSALVIQYAPGHDSQVIKIRSDKATKSLRTRSTGAKVVLPAYLFGEGSKTLELILPGNLGIQAVYTSRIDAAECEIADLGRVLATPPVILQNGVLSDYNLFRWDIMPDVLVFDFRDYATQDRYLKRLAFFVEKRGFSGKLARDMEIAGLHGWNAHDYRPEDLAAFFSLASGTDFPLNSSEKILESVLIQKNVIAEKSKGRFVAGRGAIISVSRESEAYLRSTFITHESTHALFFADKAYRDFATSAWEAVTMEERWFWRLYFGWMNYDTSSEFLMANEFQAYLLQQPVYRVAEYFQKTLPARLLEHHPELAVPIGTYMMKFGDSFGKRAASLESWVKAKYGISAGRAYFFY